MLYIYVEWCLCAAYIAIQNAVLTGVEMIALVERIDEVVLIRSVERMEQLAVKEINHSNLTQCVASHRDGSEKEESCILVCLVDVSTTLITPLLAVQGIDLHFHNLLHLICSWCGFRVLCCYS